MGTASMNAAERPGTKACAARAVSFVVPAFNEEHLLGQTLDAINRVVSCMGIAAEVIVADDASDDATAALARSHQARVISVNHRHIAATRNAGARAATGEWLIFVDADTLVTEPLTRAALAALDGGAVGGGCRVRLDGRLPLYGRVLAASLLPVYRALRLAAGCFLFCTREAFNAAGGFDETLFAAEEAVLSRALGRQGRFVILNEYVTTSGRKLRTHSGREILGGLLRLAVTGRKAVHRREGLEIWYGERRKDPGSQAEPP